MDVFIYVVKLTSLFVDIVPYFKLSASGTLI